MLQKQGRDAANHWRGHTRAAHSHVIRWADLGTAIEPRRIARENRKCRILGDQRGIRRGQERYNGVARGDEIRLHNVIERRGAFRAVAGHGLGGLQTRTVCVGCPDRDHEGIVAGRADGGVSIRAGPIVLAHVACRGHNHDACLPRGFHGLAERVDHVTFIDAAR